MAPPLHPLVWLVLAGVAIVVVLALVDAVRYRRRLGSWRVAMRRSTASTTTPTRVWQWQARRQKEDEHRGE